MAKRKKAAPKKGGTKKNQNGKSSNGAVLVIILVLVGGGAYFGLQKNGGVDQLDIPSFDLPTSSDYSPSEDAGDSYPVSSSDNSPASSESSSAVFDKTDINALDGKEEQASTNSALPDYEEVSEHYFTSSFDFGWPAYSQKDAIVEHEYFTLKYNEKTEQADWVAYKLTAENLSNAQFKRRDNFRADPLVKTESAHPNDYKGSGYDRGHLAPAADFTWSKNALDETFYMSNMSPQRPGFNRGIWKKLEEKVRTWAHSNREVFVVTGPIYKGRSEKIGKNKVHIPDQYYKVVLDLYGKETKGIAFVLENEKSSESMAEYAMSIDEAEKITGMDFFPLMPDQLESEIECCSRYSDW